jgi:alpha-tubulin suppressor-like RCC1 family protein
MFGRNTTAAILTASLASVALLAGCRGEAVTGASDLDPATFASNLRLVAGGQQTGAVALNLPQALTVRVVDAGGQPVTGAEVNWAVMSGGGTVNPPIGSSNAEGLVSTTWTLGTTLGEHRVRAYLRRGFLLDSTDFVATATPGAATVVVLDSTVTLPASAMVATTITGVRFVVRDQFGYPVQGDTVEFTPSAGGAVSPQRAVSNAQGVVTTSWTMPQLVGAPTISARLVTSGIQTPTLALQTTPDTSRVLVPVTSTLAPALVDATAGSVTVRVQDRFGNPISGATVNFADSLGVGVAVSPTTVTTGPGGTALTTVTVGKRLGPSAFRVSIAGVAGQAQRYTTETQMRFRDVYAGNYYACGIGTNDRAYCWGFGQDGQLGNGASANTNAPQLAVSAGDPLSVVSPTFREVSGGPTHQCGVAVARNVWCWGFSPDDRALGGAAGAAPVITQPNELTNTRLVASGNVHSCALSMSGVLRCYGVDDRGQVGGGNIDSLGGASKGVSGVAVGLSHTCAIPRLASGDLNNLPGVPRASQQIHCWGANERGQLGDGGTIDQDDPVPVVWPTLSTPVVGWDSTSIVAGAAHTCALEAGAATSDRRAFCWGSNSFGQLGFSADSVTAGIAFSVPRQVAGSFVRLYAGEFHTCGVTSSGDGFCWGRNDRGQVAPGSNDPVVATPRQVAGGIRAFALGELFSCYISGPVFGGGTTSAPGTIACWGDNEYGQLGRGVFSTNGLPQTIAPVANQRSN